VILTAALISHMQYRSAGPNGSSNKYMRHGLPEIYAGLSFKDGGFLGRAGVSVMNIRPQYGFDENGKKYTDWLTGISPFLYAQYTHGAFQMRAKTILAQGGEWMQLNGGYAVTGLKSDGISYDYTPINSSVSFLSLQYGKKAQVLGMIGYQKNLGTTKDIDVTKIYFSGNGFKNINQMFRLTPTFIYSLGRMQFGVEYGFTMVQYGDDLSVRALPSTNLHWVANHRCLLMAKFLL